MTANRWPWLACSLLAATAAAASAPESRTITDFHDGQAVRWAAASGLSATRGQDGALVVGFGGSQRRGLALSLATGLSSTDWAGWDHATWEVENGGPAPVRISFMLRNLPDTWADGKVAAWYVTIPGRQRVTWRCPIKYLRYTQGWEWPQEAWGGRTTGWGRVDIGTIAQAWITVDQEDQNVTLRLHALRLEHPEAATGWIDAWGQRAAVEFPGKVHADRDLVDAARREAAELKAAVSDPVFDPYHAWAGGPTRTGTGYFRVEEVDGRWWFIAPNGHLYFATGIDCVLAGAHPFWDETVASAYAWIPPKSGLFAAAWGMRWQGKYYPDGTSPSHYRANLVRTSGADHLDDGAMALAMRRLLAWGFTSIGNWSDDSLFATKQLPYVTVGPNTGDVKTMRAADKIHDVYDPGFSAEARRVSMDLARYRDDAWCLGHFVDNEVDWDDLPRKVLERGPESFARNRWVGTLKASYGSVDRLNTAWKTSATSWDTLRLDRKSGAWSEGARADATVFRGEFADAWYRIWGEAIRAADPHHLVLGSRLHGGNRPDEVVKAAGRWMDVVSFNIYEERPDPKECARWHALTGKPLFIGEYGFNSLDDGLLTTAVPVASREERGTGYRYYTEQMAAQPSFVGGHFFQYLDEPITGRFDHETSFNGFVKVSGIPDPFLVAAARATNPRIYAVHAGAQAPCSQRPRP